MYGKYKLLGFALLGLLWVLIVPGIYTLLSLVPLNFHPFFIIVAAIIVTTILLTVLYKELDDIFCSLRNYDKNMQQLINQRDSVINERYYLNKQIQFLFKKFFKETKFTIKNRVIKVKGYAFNGEIVSVFMTTQGEIRYVVELISQDTGPVLHIYNEDQLEIDPKYNK